jgi:hypothetical protein
MFQMAVKYVNNFQSKALQKVGIFGLKINQLATLACMTIKTMVLPSAD